MWDWDWLGSYFGLHFVCGIWGKKMTSRHIPFHIIQNSYDDLYRRADEILAKHNPCQIRQELDGTVSCHDTRTNTYRKDQLCCNGCEHLSISGCRVHSLACKMWLCEEVLRTPAGKAAMEEISQLRPELFRNCVPHDFRASRAKNLGKVKGGVTLCRIP